MKKISKEGKEKLISGDSSGKWRKLEGKKSKILLRYILNPFILLHFLYEIPYSQDKKSRNFILLYPIFYIPWIEILDVKTCLMPTNFSIAQRHEREVIVVWPFLQFTVNQTYSTLKKSIETKNFYEIVSWVFTIQLKMKAFHITITKYIYFSYWNLEKKICFGMFYSFYCLY